MAESGVGPGRLDPHRVGDVPTIFCVPEYVTRGEEALLLAKISSAPAAKWKAMRHRRLQEWGGAVHARGMVSQPLPPWLEALAARLRADTQLFPSPINHVLVNEYQPGQGIMAHQDGPLYYPAVAIVSLGAPAVMRFTKHQSLREAEPSVGPAGRGDSGATDPMEGPEGMPSAGTAACSGHGAGVDLMGSKDDPRWLRDGEGGGGEPGTEVSSSVGTPGVVGQVPGERQSGSESAAFAPGAGQSDAAIWPDHTDVPLPPRSLLLFTDRAYTDYLHGIEGGDRLNPEESADEHPGVLKGADICEGPSAGVAELHARTSLTFRTVIKVRRNLLKL